MAIKDKLAQGNATAHSDPLPKSMWTWVDSRLSWYYNKLEEPEQREYVYGPCTIRAARLLIAFHPRLGTAT